MTRSNVTAPDTLDVTPPLGAASGAVTSERVEYFGVFLNRERAAKYAGLSITEIDKGLHAIPPLPHWKVGENYKILRDGILPYFTLNRPVVGLAELEQK